MKNAVAILFTIFSFISIGQTNTEKYNFSDSEKIIKVDIGDIFSRMPTLGLYVESKYNEDVSFQFGAGIIPSYFQPWVSNEDNDFDHLIGYKLSAESRFYVLKKPTRYLSVGIDFQHLIIRDRDVPIGMDLFENPNGGNEYAYFVNSDMRFHQFNSTLTAKWGFQKNLGERFVFDFYLGMRIKTTNVQSRSKIPTGGILEQNWNNRIVLFDDYKNSNIQPTLGFKLGYKL